MSRLSTSITNEQQWPSLYVWVWPMLVLLGAAMFMPTEASGRGGLGMPLVVIWLIFFAMLAGYIARECKAGRSKAGFSWSWIDGLWLLFFAWHSLSVAYGLYAHTLEPRPAMGLFWQQLMIGAIYFSGRWIGQSPIAAGMFARGWVAFSLAIAGYAWYQYTVSLPELHQQYQQAAEEQQVAMLLMAGVSDTEPGARMRQLFESRLFNREPFGPFSLTNTLATALAPVIVLSFLAMLSGVWRRRWSNAVVWGSAWLVLSGALALTSSRTAILATIVASAGWLVQQGSYRWKTKRLVKSQADIHATNTKLGLGASVFWLALVSLPLLIVMSLWALGKSDSNLLSSAPASVAYRWQYWVTSWDMIRERPLLGWGAGNFQAAYAGFQSPQASETVADPHNAFFELATTTGLPAGIFFLLAISGVLGLGFRSSKLRLLSAVCQVETNPATSERPANQLRSISLDNDWALLPLLLMFLAVVLGIGSAGLGDSLPLPLSAVLLAAFVAAAWWVAAEALAGNQPGSKRNLPGAAEFELPSGWMVWSLLALLLNLMAAGGINYPAISQWLFLLAGLSVTHYLQSRTGSRTDFAKGVWRSPMFWGSVSGAAALLSIVAYQWHTVPVIRSQWAWQRASVATQWGNIPMARRELDLAIALDAWNADANFDLAVAELIQQFPHWHRPEIRQAVEAKFQLAATLRPWHSPTRLRIAETYLSAAAQPQLLEEVRQHLLKSTDHWLNEASVRKPTDARLLAQRSWLAYYRGNVKLARELAAQASDLSRQSPHADMQLDRIWFLALMEPALVQELDARPIEDSPTVRLNAAAWVRFLNNNSTEDLTGQANP